MLVSILVTLNIRFLVMGGVVSREKHSYLKARFYFRAYVFTRALSDDYKPSEKRGRGKCTDRTIERGDAYLGSKLRGDSDDWIGIK